MNVKRFITLPWNDNHTMNEAMRLHIEHFQNNDVFEFELRKYSLHPNVIHWTINCDDEQMLLLILRGIEIS